MKYIASPTQLFIDPNCAFEGCCTTTRENSKWRMIWPRVIAGVTGPRKQISMISTMGIQITKQEVAAVLSADDHHSTSR